MSRDLNVSHNYTKSLSNKGSKLQCDSFPQTDVKKFKEKNALTSQ